MEETKMKSKSKKGKVHYTKNKNYNPELVKCSGCNKCQKHCAFNNNVVHPSEANGNTYPCNSTKGDSNV